MAKKLLLLNLILVASVAVLAQRLVSSWSEFREEDPQTPRAETRPPETTSLPVLESAEPLSQFLVIAERNLFSAERAPQAPADEAEEEKPPEMPVEPKLISVFSLGDEREAVLQVFEGRRGRQQASEQVVQVGDNVQGYTVNTIEDTYLVMSWGDQNLTIELSDEGSAAQRKARPAQQAVNIITIGSAGAAVETVTVSSETQEGRGLEVAVAGSSGLTGQAGRTGMGRSGLQGAAAGRSGQMGGLQSGARGSGIGGTNRLGGQSSFGGTMGLGGQSTNTNSSNLNRRPIR